MAESDSPTVASGDREKNEAEVLLPLVYDELRKLARARLNAEALGQTLQPTALVHEAWLRLSGERDWRNRAYFFAAASTAMRHILVDRARARRRLKRGGEGLARVDLETLELTEQAPDDGILAVDEALQELEAHHPDWARIVVMKYFGGMDHVEIARALGVGERTIGRHWAGARAWLHVRIKNRE